MILPQVFLPIMTREATFRSALRNTSPRKDRQD
ncbi:unnamed protein product [Acanthoscelides obtectus]|uniref:Uncharacterized protein n=1 Tax=Acanthoscelides obtectus TaxID=200917 RepID=A0A9P0PP52_ACAOB|nr:unnamed protein product [Acanthoscelides obtectus]CAK1640480.1 hypothetical protein AOBTE_LOCUS11750 [Acanthoscelides obtectus]